eukprot:CAMPEP_0177466196 /NCGR_PEP_ID=MMETSP0369-20130122/17833_1 /TAXON_ID=447022 ORGANISM="Scrippsiella hangoei-like, Strain SHHI-4" /NCGR_SAMPLE_ID=MMETSP0369 /ASSEMBLY_ACC=CAM_ASM_000364 /LENGTH=107 /DNA_ID=CAMNT_0018940161 /DNA_START=107 /DNA_END=431 /DNA_ORIENTATION=+
MCIQAARRSRPGGGGSAHPAVELQMTRWRFAESSVKECAGVTGRLFEQTQRRRARRPRRRCAEVMNNIKELMTLTTNVGKKIRGASASRDNDNLMKEFVHVKALLAL